jgi:hypothetical protein
VAGNSTTPAGVADGLAVGVVEGLALALGLVVGLGVAVATGANVGACGARPSVLTTEPSGANSSDPPVTFDPTTEGASEGGVAIPTAGGGVGAVANGMTSGAVAEAPEVALMYCFLIVTVYAVLPAR